MRFLLLVVAALAAVEGSKCKPKWRYLEGARMDSFRPNRICRDQSGIPSEYWTTIGYDGNIKDGRSTADFLSFPGVNRGYIAYWITRTKYGPERHYEAFGHATIKPDGTVCAFFVGYYKEAVEMCNGFRVLSRSKYNPNEPNPFEWIQGPVVQVRNTLGYHHHRVAKYQNAGDESFYGDANIHQRNFQGISPNSQKFVELVTENDFNTKVWLLRRRSADSPPPPPTPEAIQEPVKNPYYSDPHVNDIRYPDQQNFEPVYGLQDENYRNDPRYTDPRYRSRLFRTNPEQYTVRDGRPDSGRTIGNTGSASRQPDQAPPLPDSAAQQQNDGWVQVQKIGDGVRPGEQNNEWVQVQKIGDGVRPEEQNNEWVQVPKIGDGVRPEEQVHTVVDRRPNSDRTIGNTGSASRQPQGGVGIGNGVAPEQPSIGQGVQPSGAQREFRGETDEQRYRLGAVKRPQYVRDQYGNTYEQRYEDGVRYYYSRPYVDDRMPAPDVYSAEYQEQLRKYQESLRQWQRDEQNYRQQNSNSDNRGISYRFDASRNQYVPVTDNRRVGPAVVPPPRDEELEKQESGAVVMKNVGPAIKNVYPGVTGGEEKAVEKQPTVVVGPPVEQALEEEAQEVDDKTVVVPEDNEDKEKKFELTKDEEDTAKEEAETVQDNVEESDGHEAEAPIPVPEEDEEGDTDEETAPPKLPPPRASPDDIENKKSDEFEDKLYNLLYKKIE